MTTPNIDKKAYEKLVDELVIAIDNFERTYPEIKGMTFILHPDGCTFKLNDEVVFSNRGDA